MFMDSYKVSVLIDEFKAFLVGEPTRPFDPSPEDTYYITKAKQHLEAAAYYLSKEYDLQLDCKNKLSNETVYKSTAFGYSSMRGPIEQQQPARDQQAEVSLSCYPNMAGMGLSMTQQSVSHIDNSRSQNISQQTSKIKQTKSVLPKKFKQPITESGTKFYEKVGSLFLEHTPLMAIEYFRKEVVQKHKRPGYFHKNPRLNMFEYFTELFRGMQQLQGQRQEYEKLGNLASADGRKVRIGRYLMEYMNEDRRKRFGEYMSKYKDILIKDFSQKHQMIGALQYLFELVSIQ